jgi:hypothetical protein
MAVVINEFEVMTDGPPPERAEPEQRGSAQTSPAADHDVERMLEHQMSRCERVRAY